jgi:hypothetical protein
MPRARGVEKLPELVGRADAAKLLGLGIGRFEGMISRGELPAGGNGGSWNPVELVKRFAAVVAGSGTRAELDKQRVRRAKNENDKFEGNVVPLDGVLDVIERYVRAITYNEDNIAGRLAMDLAGIDDAAVRKHTIRGAIIQARDLARAEFIEALRQVAQDSGAPVTGVDGEPTDPLASRVGGLDPHPPEDERGAGAVPLEPDAVHGSGDAGLREPDGAPRKRGVRKSDGEDGQRAKRSVRTPRR